MSNPASIVVPVASGATDVQAFTGRCILTGFSLRENAGTAAVATVVIRDGTTDSDPIVAVVEFAANASVQHSFPEGGLSIQKGVRIDKVAGTTEGAVYIHHRV